MPQGLAAVGWRIGVYWREDHKFYLGELASYNDEEDLYEMNYDDSKLLTAACAVPTYVCSVDIPGKLSTQYNGGVIEGKMTILYPEELCAHRS